MGPCAQRSSPPKAAASASLSYSYSQCICIITLFISHLHSKRGARRTEVRVIRSPICCLSSSPPRPARRSRLRRCRLSRSAAEQLRICSYKNVKTVREGGREGGKTGSCKIELQKKR